MRYTYDQSALLYLSQQSKMAKSLLCFVESADAIFSKRSAVQGSILTLADGMARYFFSLIPDTVCAEYQGSRFYWLCERIFSAQFESDSRLNELVLLLANRESWLYKLYSAEATLSSKPGATQVNELDSGSVSPKASSDLIATTAGNTKHDVSRDLLKPTIHWLELSPIELGDMCDQALDLFERHGSSSLEN